VLEIYENDVKQKVKGPKDSPGDIAAAAKDAPKSMGYYVVMPDGSVILVPV